MNLTDYVASGTKRASDFVKDTLENHEATAELVRAYGTLSDLSQWISVLKQKRPEVHVYELACQEFDMSFFALVAGNYRAAFS